ncbi:MAG: site-specific DNA-methyltransferase [Chloroflexi bacterium]|nr:site-specific DNA-methyltransferase [Chloroflexota bacterium]
MIRLHIGDVRAVLAAMEPGSVDLVATSWPFLALRSYLPADHPDKPFEIGQEATPGDYLNTLLDVTEGFARVLAPHGSICTELGDTMAGSGGAGGDYNADGLRKGQPKFRAGTPRWDGRPAGQTRTTTWPPAEAGLRADKRADIAAGLIPKDVRWTGKRPGWPLDKSMCVIPHLYAASLVYGRNLLNPERVTDPWRVRNIVAWVRRNPPVGALGGGTPEEGTGDSRFRPATSFLTIACKGRVRWFDLDAVRIPSNGYERPNGAARATPPGKKPNGSLDTTNPAGSPPLDWWLVNPRGYSGAHYAVWPLELLTRPIQAMCPRRVCRTCGVPSRRIAFAAAEYASLGRSWADLDSGREKSAQRERNNHSGQPPGAHIVSADYTTLGWTVCGCPDTGEEVMWAPGWREELRALRLAQKAERAAKTDDAKAAAKEAQRRHADVLGGLWRGRSDGFHNGDGWRPGVVLDPFMGSGTTAVAATGLSRDVIGIDLDRRNVALVEERLGPLMATMLEVAPPPTAPNPAPKEEST